MSPLQFALRFPYPIPASEGAWYLAVAIIGNVDLKQSRPACALPIDEIFESAEPVPLEWLKEAISRACQFNLTALESDTVEEPNYTILSLFSMIGLQNNESEIIAKVNFSARIYLVLLQQAIRQLQQQQELTPYNLAVHMERLVPLTNFSMEEDPHYKHPVRYI